MTEPQEITPIEMHELVGAAAELFGEGYRFVHVCCTTLEDSYELTYVFDRVHSLRIFRFTVTPDEELPSISVIYPNAFLYENEIQDLFGLKIKNIAVDYHGTLYRTAIDAPFSIATREVMSAAKQGAGVPKEKPEGPREVS
jgi:ech hydrogenase subunit D